MSQSQPVTPVRLRDALRAPDTRSREIEAAIALGMMKTLSRHQMRPHEAIRGLMGNILAVIQARTPLGEWREVGEEVCAELMRRLTQFDRGH